MRQQIGEGDQVVRPAVITASGFRSKPTMGQGEAGKGEGSGRRRAIGDWSIFRPIDVTSPQQRRPKTWTCPLPSRRMYGRAQHPPQGQQQERAGTAGRIEQPLARLPDKTHLIEHVPREPVGRVVFAQPMPQRPRKEILIQRLQQVHLAVIFRELRDIIPCHRRRYSVDLRRHVAGTEMEVPIERMTAGQLGNFPRPKAADQQLH